MGGPAVDCAFYCGVVMNGVVGRFGVQCKLCMAGGVLEWLLLLLATRSGLAYLFAVGTEEPNVTKY